MEQDVDLENRIREIAQQLYSASMEETPSLFDTKRWKGRLMEWAMKDELFKIQLLRFINVLPALRKDGTIITLLEDYFNDEVNTPPLIKNAVKRIPRHGFLPWLTGKLIRSNVENLAGQFIAGQDEKEVLAVLKPLRDNGYAFTTDLLGEVVVSEKEAVAYQKRYLDLLDFLSDETKDWEENPVIDREGDTPIPKVNVSIKVSSLDSQLDPVDWHGSINRAYQRLKPILDKAKMVNANVTLDMEHFYIKDLTLSLLEHIFKSETDLPSIGIALQCYLKDSAQDINRVIALAKEHDRKISVRLVKGAYWDYETIINKQKGWEIPVFLNKEETDLQFELLSQTLLDNTEFISPAFATHNLRSISNAIAYAEKHKLPKDSFEFQFLYGMAESLRPALQEMDHRIRLYVPVGELLPGMAYFVRRLLENTSNQSILRKSFAEKVPFDDLIKVPEPKLEQLVPEKEDGYFKNEPLIDFSKAENRKEMEDALIRVRSELNWDYPILISGKRLKTDRETISINPSKPAEVIGRVSMANEGHVEEALKSAKSAWNSWRKTDCRERAQYLLDVAIKLRRRRFEFMALEVLEVGKTWQEADADVAEAIDFLEYYSREMVRLCDTVRMGHYPGERNDYFYQGKGVAAVIAPWNFPLAIPMGMISAALVTGNCVIFKPAGLSPVLGWRLIDLFMRQNLPNGVLQFVNGSGDEIGDLLVSHPSVDLIAFTGSMQVGLGITKLAGEVRPGQRNVKKVIAEMGGKNAIIVDETADLDEAVKGVVKSALGFQGQKCSACSRVIVVQEVYEDFCHRLRDALDSVKIGDPVDPSNSMGPVIDEKAYQKIISYVNMAKNMEEPLLCKEIDSDGYFVGPGLFKNVSSDSQLAQEEIFGPVIALMKAKNIDDAIEIANYTVYALTGGIFSRSPANIQRVKEELQVGNLYINRGITGALVGRQPFGGFAMSGIGSKAGGPDYLLQFMNPKCSTENTLRRGFEASLDK